MKINFVTISLILLMSLPIAAREWTNLSGKKIEADFVQLEGETVTLRVGSKEYEIPLNTLTVDDQKFARKAAEKTQDEAPPAKPSPKFPLSLGKWVSGEKLNAEALAGKPIVLHVWQAHCGACPPKLLEFEKIARRKKKSGAVFLVWHSADKISLAQSKSKKIDLKIPVYHGKRFKWNKKKFGDQVWPHVVILKPDGEIVYMGKADRDFTIALKSVSVGN